MPAQARCGSGPQPRRRTPRRRRRCWRPVVRETVAYLGDIVYGVDVPDLETACMAALKKKGWTFATAESCTGGRVAERITALPGASEVYRGGVVSYWTQVKADVLGIDSALLKEYGAVSEPCARAMAENVRRITGAELAVSVTGVAGPDAMSGAIRGVGVRGAGRAGGHLLPEAGLGEAPPGPDSGHGQQPCL